VNIYAFAWGFRKVIANEKEAFFADSRPYHARLNPAEARSGVLNTVFFRIRRFLIKKPLISAIFNHAEP
jgi:hypothetical protein